ncbi:MAG: hypothetical protein ACRD2O_17130 [Terriglobia bacterium]
MSFRHIPFPVLILLGCVTLVWALHTPRRSPPAQEVQDDPDGKRDAARNQPPAQSWTGVVSDSNCGAKHAVAGDEAAQCVSECITNGAKYVLVSDGSLYQVSPQDQFAAYAGKSVTVSGSLDGDTIAIITVSPVQHQK